MRKRGRRKRFADVEAVREREKELEKIRAARRKELRQRFVRYRSKLEGRGQLVQPRKYEEWLLALGERECERTDAEETAPLPQVH